MTRLAHLWRRLGWLFATPALALAACAHKPVTVPDQRPPAVPVYIPIAKACEVSKVDPSPLPSADGVPNDIFEAVKRVLADRATLLADRTKLVAANTDPCPQGTPKP